MSHEWTMTKREVVQTDDTHYSAEHFTLQHGEQTEVFRIVAHAGTDGLPPATSTVRRDGSVFRPVRGLLDIRGEACIGMALDRLLCALRDGLVKL